MARPVASRQVAPPSNETSTPATRPPESVAVPAIVTGWPVWTVVPVAGLVIVAVGRTVSVLAVANVSPDWMVPGCAPMSAKRFTVACCMRTSSTPPLLSAFSVARPYDHRMVPALNTSAPLAAL